MHQRPLGLTAPWAADRANRPLQAALELVDVLMVDHLTVGKGKPFSFAGAGML